VGAAAALTSQFLAHYLAEQRERKRFQIQAFERFRKEFTEDQFLRRISTAKENLTDNECFSTRKKPQGRRTKDAQTGWFAKVLKLTRQEQKSARANAIRAWSVEGREGTERRFLYITRK
jgi:hypothetical protein